MIPFCPSSDWKPLGLESTDWCYLRSNRSLGRIHVLWTSNKHYLDSVGYSVVVWVPSAPRNVVFTCSPRNDRVLRTKDCINVADNSYFLNHMTVELKFGSTLPSIDMNLV